MSDNYYMKKTEKICPSCILHTGDIPPEAIKYCPTHENKKTTNNYWFKIKEKIKNDR